MPASAAIVRAPGDVAESQHLRGYDAIHLAAALAVDVTVISTADTRLIEAASRRGLATSNPVTPANRN